MNRAERARLFELADVILAISRHLNAAKDEQAVPGTLVDAAVMRFIDRHPGTTAGAAAQAAKLTTSNFSRAARALEHRGLLRREVDPDDGRRVRFYPTPAAADNLGDLHRIWSGMLDGAIGDRAELTAVLAGLHDVERHLLER